MKKWNSKFLFTNSRVRSSRFIPWPLEERPSLLCERGRLWDAFSSATRVDGKRSARSDPLWAPPLCAVILMMMAGPRLSYLFRPRHDRTGDAISAIILLEGPYSLILITRLISISMSPLMAIGIIGVRPPFFFVFFNLLHRVEENSKWKRIFESLSNVSVYASWWIEVSEGIQMLLNLLVEEIFNCCLREGGRDRFICPLVVGALVKQFFANVRWTLSFAGIMSSSNFTIALHD